MGVGIGCPPLVGVAYRPLGSDQPLTTAFYTFTFTKLIQLDRKCYRIIYFFNSKVFSRRKIVEFFKKRSLVSSKHENKAFLPEIGTLF